MSPASGSSRTTIKLFRPDGRHTSLSSPFFPAPARYKADARSVEDIDYNATKKEHRLSEVITTSTIPPLAPYAFSSVPGFTEHLDSGSAGIFRSTIRDMRGRRTSTPRQTLGILSREDLRRQRAALRAFHHSRRCEDQYLRLELFPWRFHPTYVLGDFAEEDGLPSTRQSPESSGPNTRGQSSNTPVYSRTACNLPPTPSGRLGKHTVSFGAKLNSYTQLKHDRQAHLPVPNARLRP